MSTQVQNIINEFPASSQAKKPTSAMGKDEFLKLLVMQLRFQDPMNPLKGTEFAAQLAQFSSVEQLSNINTNLTQSLQANELLAQSINNALSASMIGKEVKATANAFHFDGTTNTTLGYTLPANADSATIKIYDSAGNVVKTITQAKTDRGDNIISWNGTNDNGKTLSAGNYTFSVSALNSKGESVAASSFIIGIVNSVRFKADGGAFVVNGMEVPLANILEIRKG